MNKLISSIVIALFFAPLSFAADSGDSQSAADKLGWKLAMHSYTLNRFSIDDAIDKTASIGIKYMSVSGSINLPGTPKFKTVPTPSLTDEQIAAVEAHLKEKGIDPHFVNMGVVHPTTDEAKTRKLFEAAKRMGIDTLVAEPEAKTISDLPKVMDVVEKLAVEYNIKVAIHDHPKPSFYWNPDTVLAAVKGRSPLLGACADVGHWKRSGLDPVECLKRLQGRIITLHFKDLVKGPGPNANGLHDVPWGTGESDAKGMLEELKRQHFHGAICIEYEYHWDNSLPEIEKCVTWFNKTCAELAAEPDKQ
jgi:sugar phosphate isomerase/epimerase